MGDSICRSAGAEINWGTWFYKYVAATRLGTFALVLGKAPQPGELDHLPKSSMINQIEGLTLCYARLLIPQRFRAQTLELRAT
jgi:hypothetical protein